LGSFEQAKPSQGGANRPAGGAAQANDLFLEMDLFLEERRQDTGGERSLAPAALAGDRDFSSFCVSGFHGCYLSLASSGFSPFMTFLEPFLCF
jgi:hypothetical protein